MGARIQEAASPWSRVWREAPVATAIATWFGSGFLPLVPGTWGSLATIPVFHLVHAWAGLPGTVVFTVAVTLLGGVAAHRAAARLRISDPSQIVIDEVAGQSIALLFVYELFPASGGSLLFLSMIALSFVLFRIFDIWKPGPVGWLERLPGGLGIMSDDLLAGLFAGLLVAATHLAFFRA
ncbi:MAG: phosphatidylglycerophosphatase A [Thermoanaerobaculia bacterium]